MFEILMKQILGNVDIESIKGQVQQFAQIFAEMHSRLQRCEETMLRLERLVRAQQSTAATLLQEKELSNVNSNDDHGSALNDRDTGSHSSNGSGNGCGDSNCNG